MTDNLVLFPKMPKAHPTHGKGAVENLTDREIAALAKLIRALKKELEKGP